MSCCHRCEVGEVFDSAVARRDLRRFQRRGPDPSTRHLLAAIQARPLTPGATLLDIGGGVGAIHHVLLERGFQRATHVDASPAYLAVAADEAKRLGHGERVEFHHCQFPDEASGVSDADAVTLDRVVCCDPNYSAMLGAAARRARRVLAFSYPRDRWFTRLFISVENLIRRLARRGFRAYVHPPAAMRAVLKEAGLHLADARVTWIWAIELHERGV